MTDPYSPPQSVVRDVGAVAGTRWWLWSIRAIGAYSIFAAMVSDVNFVKMFATDSFAQSLPVHIHFFAYFMPGVLLAAGVALIFRSKFALWLYCGNLVFALLGPAILYPVYADPYVTTTILDIYRKALLSPAWIFGWISTAAIAGYAWWLNKRGRLS